MKHAPPLRLSVVTLVLFACFAASGAHAANPTSHFVKGPTPEHKNLVIFVHGVLGDSEGTWTNPENHAYWPKLVSEDPDFSEYDVSVYGYLSPLLSKASAINDIASRMQQ